MLRCDNKLVWIQQISSIRLIRVLGVYALIVSAVCHVYRSGEISQC